MPETKGKKIITTQPGAGLYDQVRAGFVAKGTSLSAWCRANEVARQNARACLLGEWEGPKAKQLRQRLINASDATARAA